MFRVALKQKWAVLIIVATTAAAGSSDNVPADPAFVAAHFRSNNLVIFPFKGSPIEIEPPNGLTVNFIALGSSADGEAVYGQSSYPDPWAGIIKIEFNRTRISIVPGSIGLGNIVSLIESPQSGKIFVSARRMKDGVMECGDFEIDPKTGTLRPLRIGAYPDCGGPISPDGKHELNVAGDQLGLRDLASGVLEVVGKGFRAAAWSPDGRWIAAVMGVHGSGRGLLLIDSNDTSKRKKLGSGDGQPVWSPDSKWLLTTKSQFSCAWTLYGQSLQAFNIGTGRGTVLSSSHCTVLGSTPVWVARGLAGHQKSRQNSEQEKSGEYTEPKADSSLRSE